MLLSTKHEYLSWTNHEIDMFHLTFLCMQGCARSTLDVIGWPFVFVSGCSEVTIICFDNFKRWYLHVNGNSQTCRLCFKWSMCSKF